MSALSLFPLSSSAIAVGDPAATRTVYLTTVALVLLGIGLAVLAWWLFRRTRPEPELFAPLEQMETRPWRKANAAERKQLLDDARPDGARPVGLEEGTDLDDALEIDRLESDSEEGDREESGDGDGDDETDDPAPAAGADDATPATDPVVRVPESGPDDVASGGGDDSGPDEEAASDLDSAEGDGDPPVAIDRAPSS